jgi:type IV pilus secretin PilQ/predicted competence protein
MRRYGIALTLSALAAFVAAGHAATGARLTAITATTGAAPAVLIEASEPVAYRTTRPDPFTVLVDLPNVAAAGYANGFTARPESPVTSVSVESARDGDGRPMARVRVGLAEPISHRVRSQRNLIFVELTPDGDAASGPVAAALASTGVPASAPAIPAARAIEEVLLEGAGRETSIVLVGNGRIAPSHVERAGPRRLYLDFPNVLASAPPVTVIQQGPVERVRVALNSQKPLVTRVVVDLERPAMHLVESVGDGSSVKISFRESAGGPPMAVPASQPAPAKAQPAGVAPPTLPAASALAAPVNPPAPQAAASQPVAALAAQVPAAPAVAPSANALQAQVPEEGKKFSGHPISLDFQGADLRAVLRTFAEISGLNIVIDPAVQGSVDVALRDVPWDQALDIILRANKLGYVVDGTIVRVAPLTVLADEEKQRRALSEQQALTGELRVMTRTLSYATADQVRPLLLKSALTQRGTIEVDARTNTLIISDLQVALDKAASLIGTLDQPQPQVEIEARIVITNKAFRREIGAQLGLGGEMSPRLGNTTPLAFPNQIVGGGRTGGATGDLRAPNAVDLGVPGATSALGLALGAVNGAFNLDVALTALESEGKLSVISTPRVSTQNNVEAEIAQGTQIPIQTVANNTITVTFKDAALVLRVTPQITAANTVIMKIALENAQADFGRSVNGIPPIDTQRANTSVLVADGATTVIGGIYFSSQETRQGRTPVLHKMPLLGWLFKNDLTNNQNNELLIFITPRILKS